RGGGGGNDSGGCCGDGVGGESAGNGGTGGGGNSGFLSFALRKEGREHFDVLGALARALRVPTGALTAAGIKDKRAVTTQRVVLRGGIPARQLLATNGTIGGVRVGSIGPAAGPLAAGDLRGNIFRVVLRGATPAEPGALVTAALEALSRSGFVNFYGTQRVGSP
ncbi:unnamed protein product, partial [Phaeothamnion confervicola]